MILYFITIRVEFTFTTYLNGTELITAIENINYKGGNTRTGAGLKYIADNFFNPASIRDVPKVSWLVLVFMFIFLFDVLNFEHVLLILNTPICNSNQIQFNNKSYSLWFEDFVQ